MVEMLTSRSHPRRPRGLSADVVCSRCVVWTHDAPAAVAPLTGRVEAGLADCSSCDAQPRPNPPRRYDFVVVVVCLPRPPATGRPGAAAEWIGVTSHPGMLSGPPVSPHRLSTSRFRRPSLHAFSSSRRNRASFPCTRGHRKTQSRLR